jgi:hypothetical protein
MARSRRRRRWIALVIVVAVVIAGVLVADHFARSRAESDITSKLQTALGDDASVETNIADRLFLASAVQNKVGEVDLDTGALTLTAAGRSIRFTSAQAELHDVAPLTDASSATVESLDATVTVDWQTLSELTGVELSYAGDGRASGVTSITAGSQSVDIAVTTGLGIAEANGKLSLVDADASLEGVTVPTEVVNGATKVFGDKLKLPELGNGLGYSSIVLTEQGATLGVHGDQVDLGALAS